MIQHLHQPKATNNRLLSLLNDCLPQLFFQLLSSHFCNTASILAESMAEDTFIDDRNNFRWKDVLSTGLRVFIAGIDGATGVAQVSGGGGTSNDMPWRDKDEDFLDWARRAMRYAHAKHYPGNRFKRSLSK